MRTVIGNFEASKTQQHFRGQTNINEIIAKYNKTGIMPVRRMSPQYGDFSNVEDYQTSVNRVMAIQEEFNQLPANIRKRFGNSPANLLEFVYDKENLVEAKKIGLIEEKVVVKEVNEVAK